MDEQPQITTTPPVHHDGPVTRQHEIEGGDAQRVGLDSLLRAEFERVTNEVAAKHTTMPIVTPVRQLVEATVRVVADLPRIPDYDHVVAGVARWEEITAYSPTEVPDHDPAGIGVQADGGTILLTVDGLRDNRLVLDPDHAEGLFLAGLAAVRAAKVAKDEAERAREQVRGALIIPEGFRR